MLKSFASWIRLQVNVAKIQQSLPELKRDGNNVLSSVWANLLYADNSTSRAGGILPQTYFIPQLIQDLQTSPDKVIADLNDLKKYCVFSNLQFRFCHLTIRVSDGSVWYSYRSHGEYFEHQATP
jgi:Zn-dependent M16 (insulinase) family peptidase